MLVRERHRAGSKVGPACEPLQFVLQVCMLKHPGFWLTASCLNSHASGRHSRLAHAHIVDTITHTRATLDVRILNPKLATRPAPACQTASGSRRPTSLPACASAGPAPAQPPRRRSWRSCQRRGRRKHPTMASPQAQRQSALPGRRRSPAVSHLQLPSYRRKERQSIDDMGNTTCSPSISQTNCSWKDVQRWK